MADIKDYLGDYADSISQADLDLLNDNIKSFILTNAKIDDGTQVPAEELVLLIAAANYFDTYVPADSFDAYKADETWLATINVINGQGGSTLEKPHSGTFTLTLPPTGENGLDRIPVGGIPGWGNNTFLIYDTAMAIPHELNHVILGLLEAEGSPTELDIATLANVGKRAIETATNPNTGEVDLQKVAVELRIFFGYHVDGDGHPIDENGHPVDAAHNRALSIQEKLSIARVGWADEGSPTLQRT